VEEKIKINSASPCLMTGRKKCFKMVGGIHLFYLRIYFIVRGGLFNL
jgi:hypothetical protein